MSKQSLQRIHNFKKTSIFYKTEGNLEVFTVVRKLKQSNLIIFILFILGIPGLNVKKYRKYWKLIHTASLVTMHVCSICNFIFFVQLIISTCSDFNCKKVTFSLIVWAITSMANWWSFYMKRFQVSEVLKIILERKHNSYLLKYNLKLNLLSVGLLILYLIYIGIISKILYVDLREMNIIFKVVLLKYCEPASFYLKFMMAVVYSFFARLFRDILPLMLSLFYIHLCLIISRLIKSCREQLDMTNSSYNVQFNIRCFISYYKGLHKLATLTESALSLQMFWLLAAQFVMVFIWLSQVMGIFEDAGESLGIEMQIFAPIEAISLFSIIFIASRINQEDEELRQCVKNVVFELSLQVETMDASNLLHRFIESKQRLVFTAWGVFYFKKHLLFACAGVLITYNLLILQLDMHHNMNA